MHTHPAHARDLQPEPCGRLSRARLITQSHDGDGLAPRQQAHASCTRDPHLRAAACAAACSSCSVADHGARHVAWARTCFFLELSENFAHVAGTVHTFWHDRGTLTAGDYSATAPTTFQCTSNGAGFTQYP